MRFRSGLFLTFIFLAAIASTPIGLRADQTTVAISFQEEQLHFDQLLGYDRVRLDGADLVSLPGEPMLPARQVMVAIPSGSQATAVNVRSLDSQELAGTYSIFPGQLPARLDGSPPPDFIKPDQDIYASAELYPQRLVHLDGQTDLAGQQMAAVTVYPLQYLPASGKLVLRRELEIMIETQLGRDSGELYTQFTQKQRRVYDEMIGQMVINPRDVILDPPLGAPSKALPSGQFDHAVITIEAFASYFDDLVDWHNRRGLRDTVVTVEWIYSNYSGSDDQERIRNFVIDAHGNWGTIYFLMGGEDEHVPFRYRNYDGTDTPSDNYYADFDDDWTCEAFVGRITGTSSAQFTCAIDKILKYERDPPLSDYPLDVLLIGMDADASTHCEELKETIDGFIPSRFNVTKVYDSHGGNHKTAAIAALNAGQNLVNHADHANSTVLGTGDRNHSWHIYRSDVDALTNDGRTSNVISLGCWPNDMTYSDCIAERFVTANPNQAGVSFTGNTRSGWYYVGNPTSLSNQLDRNWWWALFLWGQDDLGKSLVTSKHYFSQNRSDIHRHCEWTFNLLGEPAMPLWTDTPSLLDVTHPSTLSVGSSSFDVHVESGGGNVTGASVCLWKQGDVCLTESTNSSGNATFNPSPAHTGTMYITVTKHNYLPYEGSTAIAEEGPPPPVADLEITRSQSDLVLTWSPPEEKAVVHYVVYRDTLSDFVPAPEDSIGGTVDTIFSDMGVTGTEGTNYYYAVKTVNGTGQKSDPSDTVGEFDRDLINTPTIK